MPSDLTVALDRRSALLKVHTFQNSVLAVLLFDFQHGFLHILLTFKPLTFFFPLFFKSRIIHKQVKLFIAFFVSYGLFGDNMICNRTVEYIPHEGLIFTAPKTKASNRTFKVGANCMDMLREYQLYQKAERLRVGSAWARNVQVENGKTVQNDLLFTSWDGTPFDLERLTTWFPHFLRSHDLPAVHFHSLRHTYASLMIAAHVPITTVSGRLGHAQTSTTTDIYAGFIRTADAAASDAMEIVFDNIREKSRA